MANTIPKAAVDAIFPAGYLTIAACETAIERGNKVDRARKLPGFKVALRAWDNIGRKAMGGGRLSALPAELAVAQQERRACETPLRIVREILEHRNLSEDELPRAREDEREELAASGGAGASVPSLDDVLRALVGVREVSRWEHPTAVAAIEEARHVERLIKDPGWTEIARELAAQARAHWRMLEDCAAAEVVYHQAAYRVIAAGFFALDEKIRLGKEAEMWLKQQAEQSKGNERRA